MGPTRGHLFKFDCPVLQFGGYKLLQGCVGLANAGALWIRPLVHT